MIFKRLRASVAAGLALGMAASFSAAPPRVVPGKGIDVPAEKRNALMQEAAVFKRDFDALKPLLSRQPRVKDLLADIEIYYNAVARVLAQDNFYAPGDIQVAGELLKQGRGRLAQLKQGQAPWAAKTGLVVRGYYSEIDGSAQPYGLVVPESFKFDSKQDPFRLDVWYHGRNNKLTELRFIHERQTKAGQFTPADTFMLHPYGRYCNAMKFAGEVDTFEALEHAKRNYPIDENRLLVRGFSMGGAAAWHVAAHHAGTWIAASPGAGFAETAVYQNIFKKDPKPAWWEQKLWAFYDATLYARNLHHCPTIAYSGENDKQMQAADIMAEYMKKEGLDLVHIIGPGMGHKYHPESKIEIAKRLAEIAKKPRNPVPEKLRFTTYTLRYNRMLWLTVDALDEHWKRSDVTATLAGNSSISVTTENVSAFTFKMDEGTCPLDDSKSPTVTVNGQELLTAPPTKDGAWTASFRRTGDRWSAIGAPDETTLMKRHGLQGPIDDAFMDSFLFVTPTGKPMAGKEVTEWIANEQQNAVYQWWMQFRGEPRVKKDTDVTEADIANHHLVLWGDPQSNKFYRKIIAGLPIKWRKDKINVGGRDYGTEHNVPVFIFPNPENPKRYVVINSGFTFDQFGNKSNSTQVPKLPDWAILDTRMPRDKRIPTGVVDGDFFGERWEVKTSKERTANRN